MSTARNHRYLACHAAILSLVTAAQLGCGSTAHDFVFAKTGVEVGSEVRLCSSGVLHNDPECRPDGTGGPRWVKNENFDIFSLPPGVELKTYADVSAWLSFRYLGTPYWRGHLQPECKSRESLGPGVNFSAESIDLAAKLNDEISQRFAVDAIVDLRKAGIPIDFEAEAKFRQELTRIVQQKIQVRLAWFVTSYTGGRYAVEANAALGHCRREVQSHLGEGAQFVTGVAGFMLLQNDADVTINSASTLAEALRVLVGDPSHVIDAKLTSSWERTVGNVIKVNASTAAVTKTVYPLWVQFE
jgi:hypothetical protein